MPTPFPHCVNAKPIFFYIFKDVVQIYSSLPDQQQGPLDIRRYRRFAGKDINSLDFRPCFCCFNTSVSHSYREYKIMNATFKMESRLKSHLNTL